MNLAFTDSSTSIYAHKVSQKPKMSVIAIVYLKKRLWTFPKAKTNTKLDLCYDIKYHVTAIVNFKCLQIFYGNTLGLHP